MLLPVLYWLSLPPRPRKRVTTAHMLQWQAAVRRLGRRPVRLRKLRFWLLVLALIAVVGAMSGPTVGAVEGPRHLVALVDTSASLGAGTGAATAYDQLQARLRSELDTLPEHIDVRFALCGVGVSVHRGPRAAILATLPAQPSGAGTVDMDLLAAALDDEDTAVWSLTDGMGLHKLPTTGALSLFGEGGPNLAITACTIDDRWPLPDITLRVELRRFGPGTASIAIQIKGAVAEIDPVAVTLKDAGDGSAFGQAEISLRRSTGGWLELWIADAAGVLAGDDRVRVWLPEAPAPDIAVLAGPESGPAIHSAAMALARESGGRVVEPGAERAGFLLVDGGHLKEIPKRAISFGTSFGSRPASSADFAEDSPLVDWDREDQLTRGLDLSELEVQRALRASALPPGKELLHSDTGPLLVVVEQGDTATVHLACQLGDSNLPLLPVFPQLVRRAYARSYGEAAKLRFAPENLLSASESDLRPRARDASERALPVFGRDGNSLVVPLLILALFALVARVYA